MGLNDEIWPDLTLTKAECQTEEGVYATERSYPKVGKVGVGQILKWYLEYFGSYVHFSKLKHRTWTWV